MTADVELLPCPFCGGEAERIDFGAGDAENEGGSCIACTRCQSSGPVEFGRKENFVANWNCRTPTPSAPVGVLGVRHEIQNALRELDAVMTAEDNTSDAVGCAELALQRALEALAQQPAAVDEVHELFLCESSRLHLFPDRLYRFTADPDCSMCAEALSHCALAEAAKGVE